jgi:hypothetical protein
MDWIPPPHPGVPVAAQIGPQVWICVTLWQITAQVWMPPHWVGPPQVIWKQVCPQVWMPPQAVCPPQVI